ncbi:hypothetical protein R6Z07F_007328 [Ovis aries]
MPCNGQAQAGAQRRRVTKPPPAAAGGCGAARLPAAPRLWRASKLSQLQHPRASTRPQVKVGVKKKATLLLPESTKAGSRGQRKQAERETGRRKRELGKRRSECKRQREASAREPEAPRAWTPCSRARPPSDPGPEVLGARSQSRPISAAPDTSYYSPGSFGKRMAVSGSLSSLWKISLNLVFVDGYK